MENDSNINKRKDIQIYILSHKKENFIIDNSLFTPIEVGSYYNNKNPIYNLRDNDYLDNISYLNPIFLEQTGTYYILKHLLKDQKYIGVNQHRRIFDFNENTNFDEIFSKYKVILHKDYLYWAAPVERHYNLFHNIEDLVELENIINDKFQNYKDSFEKLKKLNWIYTNCCIITTKEIFKDYFNFYFNISWEFIKRKNLYTIDNIYNYGKYIVEKYKSVNSKNRKHNYKYQSRILGYLQERIMTLYIINNFKDSEILLKSYKDISNKESKYDFESIY